MKLFNSTLLKRSKIQSSTLPSSPKIILFGTPNVDTRLFATRLAIDIGVPVLSIKQIYKTILLFEESYSKEIFYRKVISILKNENKIEAALQLEAENIPEKLLNLTKNTDLGYVLYDYPNNVTQAKNLENQSNGGVNLVVNLMMNKEVAEERERIRFECGGCGREYFNKNVTFQNGVNIDGSFPEDGVCVDCGSHDIKPSTNIDLFETHYNDYEKKFIDVGGFYYKRGLLLNYEVKTGLNEYGLLRKRIENNIKF